MHRWLLGMCSIAWVLGSVSCGLVTARPSVSLPEPTSLPTQNNPQPVPETAERIPVIFDDDGSPDGTTALLYVLSHPRAELKAASISYGETHPEIYIQHVGRMMEAVGVTGVPLGYGQDSPMAGHNEFPEGVREFGNDFWGLPIPNADKRYAAEPAPQLMVATVHASPKPITVFVSGPATNLAQALQLDPSIKSKIAAVYMMGGAVYAAGNISDLQPQGDNRTAEWNIFGDPQAAKIAFEAGIPYYLIPLDATDQVSITRQQVNEWRQGAEPADFAADVYDQVLNFQGGERGKIWDLMSAAIMLDPDLCRFQPMHLQIITDDGSNSGQTEIVSDGKPNVFVCLEPDPNLILETLSDVFTGKRAIAVPAPSAGAPSQAAAPVSASAELIDSPASNAVDGNLETIWNSGNAPVQWIMVHLSAPKSLSALRLHVSQYPAGDTIHQVWAGGDPGELVLVHEFRGPTTDGDVLEFIPSPPLAGVQYVKVVTTQSPSWVAWREIEVIP